MMLNSRLISREVTMAVGEKLLDDLLEGCEKPENLLGKKGLIKQLTKSMIDRTQETGPQAGRGVSQVFSSK